MKKRAEVERRIQKAILREIRDFLRSLPSYPCPSCGEEFFDPKHLAAHRRTGCQGAKTK